MNYKIGFLLFLAFLSLVIYGCKEKDNPFYPENKEQSFLWGKINGWNMGDTCSLLFQIQGYSGSVYVFDNTRIDGAGNFSFHPKPLEEYLTIPVSERFRTNYMYISDKSVGINLHSPIFDVYFKTKVGDYGLGWIYRSNDLDTTGDFNTDLLYVTQDVTIKGFDSTTYAYSKIARYYDLKLYKGWNKMCAKYISKDSTGTLIGYYSVEADSGKWIYVKY